MNKQPLYPFTAIVGQEQMKTALVLNVINPLLGGVLIKGEKGTAKSTAVRALAALLPAREEVKGCSFSCDPHDGANWCQHCREKREAGVLPMATGRMKVVQLPIGATEDRVVGTLDLEHALKKGERKFEGGILAQANRNMLYVDEINLLEDHIVDILLDAAAMGVNTIEREGISFSHPSWFILIGTMNPEEGDLRPQLVDRFALSVEVAGEPEMTSRVEVIKRRLAFEADPLRLVRDFQQEEEKLQLQIERAKGLLGKVAVTEQVVEKTARLALTVGVDGHRADLALIKTAMTLAAYGGRTEICEEDLLQAAELALPHRLRRKPFEERRLDWEQVASVIREQGV